MAARIEPMSFPIKGINQAVADTWAPPGTMTRLDNASFGKNGELRRRPSFVQYFPAANEVRGLFTVGEEVARLSEKGASLGDGGVRLSREIRTGSAVKYAEGGSNWAPEACVASAALSPRPLEDRDLNVTSALLNDRVFTAWWDPSEFVIRWTVVERTTSAEVGRGVIDLQVSGEVCRVQAISNGGTVLLAFSRASLNRIYFTRFTMPSTNVIQSAISTSFVADVGLINGFRLIPYWAQGETLVNSGEALLVMKDAAANEIQTFRVAYGTSMAVTAHATYAPPDPPDFQILALEGLSAHWRQDTTNGTAHELWVFYTYDDTTRHLVRALKWTDAAGFVSVFDTSATTTIGFDSIETVATCPLPNDRLYIAVYGTQSLSTPRRATLVHEYDTTGTLEVEAYIGGRLLSDFAYDYSWLTATAAGDAMPYVMLGAGEPGREEVAICRGLIPEDSRLSDAGGSDCAYFRPVARLGVSDSAAKPCTAFPNTFRYEESLGGFVASNRRRTANIKDGNVFVSEWLAEAVTLRRRRDQHPLAVPYGRSTIVANGDLWLYGAGTAEPLTPVPVTLSRIMQLNQGAQNISSGDVFLLRLQEDFTNSAGLQQRGRPSEILAFTGASNDSSAGISAEVALPLGKPVNQSLKGYRSVAGGTTLYLTKNSRSIDFDQVYEDVSFDFQSSDAAITDNPTFVDGELEPEPVPLPVSIASAGERLWAVDAYGGVWYSKLPVPGRAPEFNSALRLQMPPGASQARVVADLDGTPIVFTDSEIFQVVGDGEDNNGEGTPFLANQVAANIGCSNPRSVTLCAEGIVFQAKEGIRLLNRGRAISKIEDGLWGDEVRDFMRGATVVCSLTREKQNEVLLLLNTSRVLVYNVPLGRWSTWTLMNTDAEGGEFAFSMVEADTALYYVSNPGSQNLEHTFYIGGEASRDTDFQEEDSLQITMDLQTAWISTADILGYQRVTKVLVDHATVPAGLTDTGLEYKVEIEADGRSYSPSVQTVSVVNATAGSGGKYRVEEIPVKASLQKNSKFRLRFYQDGTTEAASCGIPLRGVQLNVAVIGGRPATSTADRGG